MDNKNKETFQNESFKLNKVSFYDEEDKKNENSFQESENDNHEINENNENNEDNENNKNLENKTEDSNNIKGIKKEILNMLQEAEKNLSKIENIEKEYNDLLNTLYSHMFDFAVYERVLISYQTNYQELVNKFDKKEVNDGAFQILNAMIESAINVDYYFSLLMKNSIINFDFSIIEIERRKNFILELLLNIMKDVFSIENPQEKFKELYNEYISS